MFMNKLPHDYLDHQYSNIITKYCCSYPKLLVHVYLGISNSKMIYLSHLQCQNDRQSFYPIMLLYLSINNYADILSSDSVLNKKTSDYLVMKITFLNSIQKVYLFRSLQVVFYFFCMIQTTYTIYNTNKAHQLYQKRKSTIKYHLIEYSYSTNKTKRKRNLSFQ